MSEIQQSVVQIACVRWRNLKESSSIRCCCTDAQSRNMQAAFIEYFHGCFKPTPSTPPMSAEAGCDNFSKITSQVCALFAPFFYRFAKRNARSLAIDDKSRNAASTFNVKVCACHDCKYTSMRCIGNKRLVPFNT